MELLENSAGEAGKRGSIEVITGSMFSGKTEELIRRLRRAQFAGLKVEIFKPSLDKRYSESRVVSHDEKSIVSTPVDNASSILLLAGDVKVVGIDEAQFFDDLIVEVVDELAERGLRVIVAGLDLNFKGEPFGCMPVLMARAEMVDKLQAICMVCGESACRTQRLVNGHPANYHDPVVIVGASELYEARCRQHHQVPRSE